MSSSIHPVYDFPAIPRVQFFGEEQMELRRRGLVVFHNRLTIGARPPISDTQLAQVQKALGRQVPEGLDELWRASFGGTLDYGLQVSFGQRDFAASLTELFYPGGEHHNALFGWIDHERELWEEQGGAGSPPAIPFGGFEYLERVSTRLRIVVAILDRRSASFSPAA